MKQSIFPRITLVTAALFTYLTTPILSFSQSLPPVVVVRHPFVIPSLEILSEQPASPAPYGRMNLTCRLTNDDVLRKVRNGWIQAEVISTTTQQVVNDAKNRINVVNLAAGNSTSGILSFDVVSPGPNEEVEVDYFEGSVTEQPKQPAGPGHILLPTKFTGNKTSTAVYALPFTDVDQDSIDDNTEHALLQRFRPYYMFSKDGSSSENFNPTDPLWYIGHACILTNNDDPYTPKWVLSGTPMTVLEPPHFINGTPIAGPIVPGDINSTHHETSNNYHLSVIGHYSHANGLIISPEDNDAIHGNPWQAVRTDPNLVLNGFFGHVARIRLSGDPDNFSFDSVANGTNHGNVYYKVEYWQFFAFNSVHEPANFGDHEGDWDGVQVLYDPLNDRIVSTFHFAHGDCYTFNMDKAQGTGFSTNQDGQVKELQGPNFRNNAPVHLASIDVIHFAINKDPAGEAQAQNNVVRLFQDPTTKEFSHPVCYIEHSSHEFYPTQNWDFSGAPNHNGDDAIHCFLTNTPPNLGEVEHLMTETTEAAIVLRWNGYWGAYDHDNDPPMGPALHKGFTWPPSSSIKWQLPALAF